MYRMLVTINLLLVAGTSAYMSVYGLMSMFISHTVVIICMGLGMECGKVLTVSYLYRNWQNISRFSRLMYILVVLVLVSITSLEIIGFLSQSHMSSSRNLSIANSQLQSLKKEVRILEKQIEVIDNTLAGLPISHVTRRINERKAVKYEKKQAMLLQLQNQQATLETDLLKDRQWAGPIFAISRLIKVEENEVAVMFILLLVLVLEPLSIGLTLAASALWTTPVAMPERKPAQNTGQKDSEATLELRSLCDKFDLSVAQIADITGRKKHKTCAGWLNGSTTVPERALKAVQLWAQKASEKHFDRNKIAIVAK